MANINQWKTIYGNLHCADDHNIDHIRGDLRSLNEELQTKADVGPIWKRVEEKADCTWVNWLEKEILAKLRLDHETLAQGAEARLRELERLLQELPSELQESVGTALRKLCDEQLSAIARLCDEKLPQLAQLEQQARDHATNSAARKEETAAVAQSGVEAIRRELEALKQFAERTQADFAGRLQAAEAIAQRAQELERKCREEFANQITDAEKARDAAASSAADTQRQLAGCDTFWGRVRWLCAGAAK